MRRLLWSALALMLVMPGIYIGQATAAPAGVFAPYPCAPVQFFEREGTALVNGTPSAGSVVSAWIDGVKYGFNATSPSGSFSLQTNGTDWNPSGINKVKSGGEGETQLDGDSVVYRIDRASGQPLYAGETDTFIYGTVKLGDLNFAPSQPQGLQSLKIFRVFFSSAQGSQLVVVKNTGSAAATVANNWAVKADGPSSGNYSAWQVPLKNGAIAPGGTLEADIGPGALNQTSGDLELCWKDTSGAIAGGEWVVADRIEWAATPSSHDRIPSNTTLEDKAGIIPQGWHLERKSAGTKDTDNCNSDFDIVQDAAGSLGVAVTSPQSGASWPRGSTRSINWTISGASTYAAFINLSSDSGATFSPLASQNPSQGSHSWKIPFTQALGAQYVIRVDAVDLSNMAQKGSGISDAFSIVEGGTIKSVAVYPASPVVLYIGAKQQFRAQGYNSLGEPIAAGATYMWSPDGPIGTPAPPSGQFTNLTAPATPGAGWLNVTAYYQSADSFNSTAVEITSTKPVLHHVLVSPAGPLALSAGEAVQFMAEGYTVDNKSIGGAAYSWAAVPASLGAFSPASGQWPVFTAGANPTDISGKIRVNATYSGTTVTKELNITVSRVVHVDRVAIQPASVTLMVGQTANFTAIAYDSSDNPIPSATFNWTAEPPVLGTITQIGVFTALSIGAGNVTATAEGISAKAAVSVSQYQPWVASYLKITPKSAENITIDTSMTFSVEAYAANDTAIPGYLVAGLFNWSITPAEVASLAPSGANCTIVAAQEGSATISVNLTYGGATVAVNATVTVQGRSPGFDITGVFVAIGVAAVIVTAVRAGGARRRAKGKKK